MRDTNFFNNGFSLFPERFVHNKPTPDTGKDSDGSAEYKPPAEYEGEKKTAIDRAKAASEGKIKEAEGRLAKIGGNMPAEVRQQLTDYFSSSVDRADANNDQRISAEEVKAYEERMLKQVDKVLEQYAPTDAQIDALKKKEAAAKNVEKVKTSENLPSLDTIPAGVGDIGVDKLGGEMEKFSKLNETFQKAAEDAVKESAVFQKAMENYTNSRKGILNSASHFLKRLFTNKDEAECAQLNQQLESAKININNKAKLLKTQKDKLNNYGKELGQVADKEKAKLIKERETKIKDTESKKGEQKKTIEAKQKQYKALEEQQKKLIQRRDALTKESETVAKKDKELKDKKDRIDNRKKAAEGVESSAAAEVAALELLINDSAVSPEGKKAIEERLKDAKSRQEKAATTKNLLTEAGQSAGTISRALNDKEKAVAKDVTSTTSILNNQVAPAAQSLDGTISYLEDVKLQYATSAEEVRKAYDSKIKNVESMDTQVDDAVLMSNLNTSQGLAAVENAAAELNKIPPITGDNWAMCLVKAQGEVWSGVWGGIGGVFHGIGKQILDDTHWMIDAAYKSDSWYGKYLGGIGANVVGFFTGAVGGACEIVGGLGMMLAEPVQTAKGLGSLIGRNPETGEWAWGNAGEAWLNMGKAIVGYEEFEKGYIGTGAGKAFTNIATFFVGGGEAGAAAKAANASKLARAASLAARGGAEAAGLGARVAARAAETAAFFRVLATEGAKSAGRSIAGGGRAVGRGLSNAAKAVAEKPSLLITAPVKAPFQVAAGAAGLAYKAGTALFRAPGRALNAIRKMNVSSAARAEARMNKAASTLAKESAAAADAEKAIATIIKDSDDLSKLAKTNPELARIKALQELMKTKPELVQSYFKAQEAVEELQKAGAQHAAEVSKAVNKVKQEPGYREFARLQDRLDDLKKNPDKNAVAITEAEDAMAKFEKTFKDDVGRFRDARAVEEELARLRGEQQQLHADFTARKGVEDAAAMEAEYSLAKRLAESADDAPVKDLVKRYKEAVTSGDEAAIARARAEFGRVGEGSDLAKMLDDIKAGVEVKDIDILRSYYKKIGLLGDEQPGLIQIYESYQAALKNGDMAEMARIRQANPMWAEALEGMGGTEAFLQRNTAINRQIGELRLRSELDDVVRSEMTASEAADAIAAKYKKVNFGSSNEVSTVRELTLEGKTYAVRISADGKAGLYEGDNLVRTTKMTKEAVKGLGEAKKGYVQVRKLYGGEVKKTGAVTAETEEAFAAASQRMLDDFGEARFDELRAAKTPDEIADMLQKEFKQGELIAETEMGVIKVEGKAYKVSVNSSEKLVVKEAEAVGAGAQPTAAVSAEPVTAAAQPAATATDAVTSVAGKTARKPLTGIRGPTISPFPARTKLARRQGPPLRVGKGRGAAAAPETVAPEAATKVAARPSTPVLRESYVAEVPDELANKILKPAERDFVTVGQTEYRFVRGKWQQKVPDRPWHKISVAEGEFITPDELLARAKTDVVAKAEAEVLKKISSEDLEKLRAPQNRDVIHVEGGTYRYSDGLQQWERMDNLTYQGAKRFSSDELFERIGIRRAEAAAEPVAPAAAKPSVAEAPSAPASKTATPPPTRPTASVSTHGGQADVIPITRGRRSPSRTVTRPAAKSGAEPALALDETAVAGVRKGMSDTEVQRLVAKFDDQGSPLLKRLYERSLKDIQRKGYTGGIVPGTPVYKALKKNLYAGWDEIVVDGRAFFRPPTEGAWPKIVVGEKPAPVSRAAKKTAQTPQDAELARIDRGWDEIAQDLELQKIDRGWDEIAQDLELQKIDRGWDEIAEGITAPPTRPATPSVPGATPTSTPVKKPATAGAPKPSAEVRRNYSDAMKTFRKVREEYQSLARKGRDTTKVEAAYEGASQMVLDNFGDLRGSELATASVDDIAAALQKEFKQGDLVALTEMGDLRIGARRFKVSIDPFVPEKIIVKEIEGATKVATETADNLARVKSSFDSAEAQFKGAGYVPDEYKQAAFNEKGHFEHFGGVKEFPDGRLELSNGTVKYPDGRIKLPDGTVKNVNGTIEMPPSVKPTAAEKPTTPAGATTPEVATATPNTAPTAAPTTSPTTAPTASPTTAPTAAPKVVRPAAREAAESATAGVPKKIQPEMVEAYENMTLAQGEVRDLSTQLRTAQKAQKHFARYEKQYPGVWTDELAEANQRVADLQSRLKTAKDTIAQSAYEYRLFGGREGAAKALDAVTEPLQKLRAASGKLGSGARNRIGALMDETRSYIRGVRSVKVDTTGGIEKLRDGAKNIARRAREVMQDIRTGAVPDAMQAAVLLPTAVLLAQLAKTMKGKELITETPEDIAKMNLAAQTALIERSVAHMEGLPPLPPSLGTVAPNLNPSKKTNNREAAGSKVEKTKNDLTGAVSGVLIRYVSQSYDVLAKKPDLAGEALALINDELAKVELPPESFGQTVSVAGFNVTVGGTRNAPKAKLVNPDHSKTWAQTVLNNKKPI